MTNPRAPKDQPRWLVFVMVPPRPRRLTPTWEVHAKAADGGAGARIGTIAWWAPWRKYAFFPVPDTLYEPVCLRDLARFIEERMAERKETPCG